MQIWSYCSWMALVSKLINMQLALKKENPVYENEAIGRSRGGLTSKLHCVVGRCGWLGNPG